jgi:hypothetical protein
MDEIFDTTDWSQQHETIEIDGWRMTEIKHSGLRVITLIFCPFIARNFERSDPVESRFV